MYNLYEFWGLLRFEPFSDDLYDNGVYNSTGIAAIIIVFLGMVIFYMIKTQKPITFRLTAWFITILLISFINFGIAYTLSYSTLYGVFAQQNQDLTYGFGSFAGFALINFVWSLVFCTGLSVAIQLFFKNMHGNVPFKFRKSHK